MASALEWQRNETHGRSPFSAACRSSLSEASCCCAMCCVCTRRRPPPAFMYKIVSFFEFSLCLSRACLGKMIIFKSKRTKSSVFAYHTTSGRDGILGNKLRREEDHRAIGSDRHEGHNRQDVPAENDTFLFSTFPVFVPSLSWQRFGFV